MIAAIAALAAILLLVVVQAFLINRNAKAAARAQATAIAAQRVNIAQTRIRKDLVRRFAASDRRLCVQLESIKERIRATVHVDDKAFLAQLGQLGIAPDSAQARALLAESRARERDALERFAPVDCTRLPR